jgi:putative PEP-CTERM system histidine kinase
MSAVANPLAIAAYGLTAVAYAALSAQLLMRVRRSPRAQLLLAAAVLSVVWALCGTAFALRGADAWLLAQQLADAARIAAWGLFLAALLPHAAQPSAASALVAPGRAAIALSVGTVLALASVMLYLQGRPGSGSGSTAGALLYGLWVLAAILGLSVCEQLFRQTPADRRWALKPLCLGLAAICVFDLFLFSQAMLVRQLDLQMWSVRGLAHAMPIPLVMLATARNRQWTIDLGVSRSVVVGSLAVLLSGAYLLAVAGAGYLVRVAGGDWGRAMQVTFLFGAILLLALLFFSGTLRSRLRVFVSKHFFSFRYDYRAEWLKFTGRLGSASDSRPIAERTIEALADLVESPGGVLWLRTEDGRLAPAARWNMPAVRDSFVAQDGLAAFLSRTGWILELHGAHPPGLRIPDFLARLPHAWLLVPLPAQDGLIGCVLLARSRTQVDVNWEVRDLLKTAARQAAAFLGHVRSAEALAEARQFDAYNRMSAFVVHDLKNLVAQLSLMLRNAQRHAANPAFQRDMLETVEHAVERMNRLLLQLRSGTAPLEKPAAVDLAAVMQIVHAAHAGQGSALKLDLQPGLRALGHEERLVRVVGHLVQNAIDASSEGSCVCVRTYAVQQCAVIEVSDTGQGMTEAFVREHLFKPFRTTKPAGMGIGAYESQQYVLELGGRIEVDSTPGVGTQMRVHLPLADVSGALAPLQEAAA